MVGIDKRIALGFVAAVISVLTFHQGMWIFCMFSPFRGLACRRRFQSTACHRLACPGS